MCADDVPAARSSVPFELCVCAAPPWKAIVAPAPTVSDAPLLTSRSPVSGEMVMPAPSVSAPSTYTLPPIWYGTEGPTIGEKFGQVPVPFWYPPASQIELLWPLPVIV